MSSSISSLSYLMRHLWTTMDRQCWCALPRIVMPGFLWESLMFEFLVTKVFAPGLSWIFGAGVVGCVIVIPVWA